MKPTDNAPTNGSAIASTGSSLDSAEDNTVHLKKTVGLFNGVAMIVGLVVGSGIFVSPVGVLRSAGSVGLSLIFWVLGGVVACIGSMVYVELGTTYKESGGDYSYIGRAFGPAAQMCYVWAYLWIVWPVSSAVIALTFANYALEPFFESCEPPAVAVSLLAATVIVFLTAVNSANVDWATKLTDLFTILKIGALLLITITGLVFIGKGKTENFNNMWENTSQSPLSWARAIYSSVYSYSGWNYLNSITEEVKHPHKTLPRAIWISIPLITVLYTATNVAFIAILSPQEQLQSTAVAVLFGYKTLGIMYWIIPVLVACSTFGSLNGCIFTSSRLYYVAARNGQLPRCLGTINTKFFTPMVSLVFQCGISLCMLVSRDILMLINYSVFVETTFIGLTVAGMILLRKDPSVVERPQKVSLIFPVLYLCFCLFLLTMTLIEGATESLIGVAVVMSAIPAYWVFICWKKKPKVWLQTSHRINAAVQKLFYSRPEEGKHS